MKLINFITALFLLLFLNNLFSKNISFEGLQKLNTEDLDKLVSIDLYKDDYLPDELNTILRDLYNSKLIEDVELEILNDKYLIKISETKIINKIYLNGNLRIKDLDLLNNLSSKSNNLFDKVSILDDINFIRKTYLSSGYYNVSVNSSIEKYSDDKVNLIFNIYEGDPYQISRISFLGNNFFSDKFLSNLISSRSVGYLNFLTTGSNFNPETYDFDKNKIISKYREKGFFYADVSYKIKKINNSNFELIFYVEENERVIISDIVSEINAQGDKFFQDLFSNLNQKILKNNYFYDQNVIQKEIDIINQDLIDNNIYSYSYQANLIEENKNFFLSIYKNPEKKLLINQINIEGNSITRDKVLRSKLTLEPGDFYLSYNKDKSQDRLNNLRYVNSTNVKVLENGGLVDFDISIDENKKTGNLLFAGSFTGDTGLGFVIGLNDYNYLGSGNEFNSTFNINSEKTSFSINYKQYLINNPNLTNNYSIFSVENDLSDSFGFKSDENGIGYSIGFDYNEKVNMSFGIKYITKKNHSGKNSSEYIQDNIGNFNQFSINYFIDYDSTNDFFYPTKGANNRLSFELSPNAISDDSYYKLRLFNDLYFSKTEKNNFFFLSNRFGVADSLNGNLKTTNVFSLGGLNFKGFDYRGVGPVDQNIYLGGNNFYTSTIGYGGKFLFDKSDNINFRTFITSGSIWGSDYSTNNSFHNRFSAGISIDIMTAVFPVSFSYAIPIEKEDEDNVRRFNFTIGTSF